MKIIPLFTSNVSSVEDVGIESGLINFFIGQLLFVGKESRLFDFERILGVDHYFFLFMLFVVVVFCLQIQKYKRFFIFVLLILEYIYIYIN